MAMLQFAERIKQYSAKEQAELRVRVMLPGNMFPGLSDAVRAAREVRGRGVRVQLRAGAHLSEEGRRSRKGGDLRGCSVSVRQ